MRLLSFISEIEKALVANSPAADTEPWATLRVVNFGCQLARLSLVARAHGGVPAAGAAVSLQSLVLANGSRCLKARIEWPGGSGAQSFTVYGAPDVDWNAEAHRIATVMMDGPATPVAKAA